MMRHAEVTGQIRMAIKFPVEDQEILTGRIFKYGTGHTVPTYGLTNGQYVCNITIGTPWQEFEVILDASSSMLWLPRVQCDSNDLKKTICRDIARIRDLTIEGQLFAGAGAFPGVDIA